MRAAFKWITTLAVSLSALQAQAAPAVFFGEDLGVTSAAQMVNSFAARSQFLSRMSGYGLDGFENIAAGTTGALGLNFAGTGVTASMTGSGAVLDAPLAGGRFAVEGSQYLNTFGNRRIDFSTPVAAFGIFVNDANEVDNDPATLTIGGQLLTAAQIAARPFGSIDGIFRIVTERSPGVFELLFSGGAFPADLTGMFVGLLDAQNPYTNIILVNGAAGVDAAFTDGFGYDSLIVATPGQVPAPGTLALVALALPLLSLRRRAAR